MNRLITILTAVAFLGACEQDRPQPPPEAPDSVSDTAAAPTYDPPTYLDSGPVAAPHPFDPRNYTRSARAAGFRLWVDTTKLADSALQISWKRVVTDTLTDSVRLVRLVKPRGLPNGPFHLPPDSYPAAPRLGYSGTFRFAHSSGRYIVSDLTKAQAGKVRVVVGISRNRFKSGKDASGADTGLSVRNGLTEIAALPWAGLKPFIDDGTVIGFYACDDCSSEEWGRAPMPVKMARWDSIYGELRRRAPTTARIIRAKASELKEWGYTGQNITTVWAQGRGPYRDFVTVNGVRNNDPKLWVASVVADAKSLKMGLILGHNLLDGGCGPTSLGSCRPGVAGSGILGTTKNAASVRRYQITALEFLHYKTAELQEPYNCASIDWQWSPIWSASVSPPARTAEQIANVQAFHRRPDIQAAAKSLALIAAGRDPASCIHPDRR